jgi:NADH dehydrogenase
VLFARVPWKTPDQPPPFLIWASISKIFKYLFGLNLVFLRSNNNYFSNVSGTGMRLSKKNSIVIIGANVAGLALCKGLETYGLHATVIDPADRFEWFPNMHEIVSDEKPSELLSFNKSSLLANMGHSYISSRLISVDYKKKKLKLENGEIIDYEKVVFSVGGVNRDLGVKNAELFSYTFKSLSDAERIREKYKELLSREDSYKQQDIVIVGAGIEGVEVLGELLKLKPGKANLKIHLINSQSGLFNDYGNLIHGRITKKSRGEVNFIHRAKVKDLTSTSVILDNGLKIDSQLVIWTGGVAPSKKLKEWGLTKNPEEWIPVNELLSHKKIDDVYALGDCVDLGDGMSKQASIAIDMGARMAENFHRESVSKNPKAFKMLDKPILITFGNRDAYLILGKNVFASRSLLPLKEFIYQIGMYNMGKGDGFNSILASLQRAKPLISHAYLRHLVVKNSRGLFDSTFSLEGFRD